jgi:hypothetical protein
MNDFEVIWNKHFRALISEFHPEYYFSAYSLLPILCSRGVL